MTVTVYATQPVYVEGRLMDENESVLTLRVKKPRSSKYYLKQILKSQIICMTQAEEDEGTFVWATLRNQRDVLDSMTGTVEVTEDGFVAVTDEDGKVLMVAADCAEIEGDDTEAEAEGKKASKKPAAKKASKKDDDEEDDSDDGDEDDEEEEKPRKSSKGKGKGKAKKVVDDDDDDDEEEDDEEDEKPRKSSKGKGGKSKKVEEEDEGWDD
jgi:hypothetical protein